MKNKVKSLIAGALILCALGTSITFADANSDTHNCEVVDIVPNGVPGEGSGHVHKWVVVDIDYCIRECGARTLDLLRCFCGDQKLKGYAHDCPNR